jgi:hypothetical protein
MSRLADFLDIWLTDGGEIRLNMPGALNTQEDSWYSFLLEAELTPGP